ncbi:MAG TPA: carbohydrate-binding family 9-like protein [Polyangia bacterium]
MSSFRRTLFSALLLAPLLLSSPACVEQDDDKPTEEDMKAVRANLLATPPTPRSVVNADLDGKLAYLGMDFDPPVAEPGKPLKLTHYWKSVASPGDGWRIFTHLEGSDHQGFLNADHGPVAGKYSVNQWKPGEIIRDEQTVTLPANWTANAVLVYVGSWRGQTRLTVKSGPSDGNGRVLAATIPVKKSEKPAAPRKRYVARRVDTPIKIDGKLDEQAWKDAPSTGAFVNTMNGGPAEPATEAKLLWDDKFLYVAFMNSDLDIWSSLTKRDDKLWTQEADEMMIDADGNGRGYIELQVAPNGNIFDTYLPTYRKYEDSLDPKLKPYSWNSKMNAKVTVDGTLNKHDDQDRSWTVELALPLGDVKGMDVAAPLPRLPPSQGDVWRVNMFRMDLPQGKAQQAVGWSPPLVGDFHALDKFGELAFGDVNGSLTPPPAPAVAVEPAVPEKNEKKKGGKGHAHANPKKKAAE